MQSYMPNQKTMERLQQLADEAGVSLDVFLAKAMEYNSTHRLSEEERQRKLAYLRQELRIAEEQIERGEVIRYNSREELEEDIERLAEEKRQAGTPVKDAVKPLSSAKVGYNPK